MRFKRKSVYTAVLSPEGLIPRIVQSRERAREVTFDDTEQPKPLKFQDLSKAASAADCAALADQICQIVAPNVYQQWREKI